MKANTSLVFSYRKDVSSREFCAACETNIGYENSIKLNEATLRIFNILRINININI